MAAGPRQEGEEPKSESGQTVQAERLIAIDHEMKWVLIEGYAPVTGRKKFHLMVALVELHCEDREKGRRFDNYRTISASELADRLRSDEEGVRQTIARIRSDLEERCIALDQPKPTLSELIENVRGQGYRINPAKVRVLAPHEIRDR
jgi:hypothetical protein